MWLPVWAALGERLVPCAGIGAGNPTGIRGGGALTRAGFREGPARPMAAGEAIRLRRMRRLGQRMRGHGARAALVAACWLWVLGGMVVFGLRFASLVR